MEDAGAPSSASHLHFAEPQHTHPHQHQAAPNPDAQTTVTDFSDYTEHLPADITRSLRLIGDLDGLYNQERRRIHELTQLLGRLPDIPANERPDPALLRRQIAEALGKARTYRESSYAESARMYKNVERHNARLQIIQEKLKQLPEPPSRDPTPIPISPQAARPVPRIYDRTPLNIRFDAARTAPSTARPRDRKRKSRTIADTSDESGSERDAKAVVHLPPSRGVKRHKDHTPKPRPTPRPRLSGLAPISTSHALALLTPPPADAKPGSKYAPWFKLTDYEMAVLRKTMKKNAMWTPSDTMIRRELDRKGRGHKYYEVEKQRCEATGEELIDEEPYVQNIEQLERACSVDADILLANPEALDPGAISRNPVKEETATSNRGMKLNEAKEAKRARAKRETDGDQPKGDQAKREAAMRDLQQFSDVARQIQLAAHTLHQLNFPTDPVGDGTPVRRLSIMLEGTKRKRTWSLATTETPEDATREGSHATVDTGANPPEPKRLRLTITQNAAASQSYGPASPQFAALADAPNADVPAVPSPAAQSLVPLPPVSPVAATTQALPPSNTPETIRASEASTSRAPSRQATPYVESESVVMRQTNKEAPAAPATTAPIPTTVATNPPHETADVAVTQAPRKTPTPAPESAPEPEADKQPESQPRQDEDVDMDAEGEPDEEYVEPEAAPIPEPEPQPGLVPLPETENDVQVAPVAVEGGEPAPEPEVEVEPAKTEEEPRLQEEERAVIETGPKQEREPETEIVPAKEQKEPTPIPVAEQAPPPEAQSPVEQGQHSVPAHVPVLEPAAEKVEQQSIAQEPEVELEQVNVEEPEVQPEVQSEVEPEAKVEVQAEREAMDVDQPETAPAVLREASPTLEQKLPDETNEAAVPERQPELPVEVGAEAETKDEVEAEAKADAEAEPGVEAGAEVEAGDEVGAEAGVEAGVEVEAEATAEPEPESMEVDEPSSALAPLPAELSTTEAASVNEPPSAIAEVELPAPEPMLMKADEPSPASAPLPAELSTAAAASAIEPSSALADAEQAAPEPEVVKDALPAQAEPDPVSPVVEPAPEPVEAQPEPEPEPVSRPVRATRATRTSPTIIENPESKARPMRTTRATRSPTATAAAPEKQPSPEPVPEPTPKAEIEPEREQVLVPEPETKPMRTTRATRTSPVMAVPASARAAEILSSSSVSEPLMLRRTRATRAARTDAAPELPPAPVPEPKEKERVARVSPAAATAAVPPLRPRPARSYVPAPKAMSEEPTLKKTKAGLCRPSIASSQHAQAQAQHAALPTRTSTRQKPPPKGNVSSAEDGGKTVTNVKRAAGSKTKKKAAPAAAKETKGSGKAPAAMELEVLEEIDPNEPRYCFCDDVSYGEMIQCDNHCEREWFHLECLNMTSKDIPARRVKWFCPDCRVAKGTDAYGKKIVPEKGPASGTAKIAAAAAGNGASRRGTR